MTFQHPPFSPPTDLDPVGLFMLLQPKKSGKSTLADLLCSTLVSYGYGIAAFRNDVHNRLDRYVKSQRIELATTHDMISGNLSLDLDRHEVMIQLIENLLHKPRTAIIYDSSAAAGERLPTILHHDLYADQLKEHSRSSCTLVPLRPADDVSAGALYAMQMAETALGGLVVPVIMAQDVDIAALPKNSDFFKCVNLAKHGAIRLPYIPPAIAFNIDRLTLPLSDLIDTMSLQVRRRVRSALSCSTGQAGLTVAAVAGMIEVIERELGKLNIERDVLAS